MFRVVRVFALNLWVGVSDRLVWQKSRFQEEKVHLEEKRCYFFQIFQNFFKQFSSWYRVENTFSECFETYKSWKLPTKMPVGRSNPDFRVFYDDIVWFSSSLRFFCCRFILVLSYLKYYEKGYVQNNSVFVRCYVMLSFSSFNSCCFKLTIEVFQSRKKCPPI